MKDKTNSETIESLIPKLNKSFNDIAQTLQYHNSFNDKVMIVFNSMFNQINENTRKVNKNTSKLQETFKDEVKVKYALSKFIKKLKEKDKQRDKEIKVLYFICNRLGDKIIQLREAKK